MRRLLVVVTLLPGCFDEERVVSETEREIEHVASSIGDVIENAPEIDPEEMTKLGFLPDTDLKKKFATHAEDVAYRLSHIKWDAPVLPMKETKWGRRLLEHQRELRDRR